MAQRYGSETPVLDWRGRLVCSKCGSRQIDMVVTGDNAAPRVEFPWPKEPTWVPAVTDTS
jgi:hypothetical protein